LTLSSVQSIPRIVDVMRIRSPVGPVIMVVMIVRQMMIVIDVFV